MNWEAMPSAKFTVQDDGYLPTEWQNWFSMNSQNMQTFFANVGHLSPSRTDADVQALSNAGVTDPTKFKARTLYNDDTSNFMGNVAGEFQNYSMNTLTSRASVLANPATSNRIQHFGDENNNLYASVNDAPQQVPRLTTTSVGTLNFKIDGSGNLFATINGVDKQIMFV